jgi:hypothetical protein
MEPAFLRVSLLPRHTEKVWFNPSSQSKDANIVKLRQLTEQSAKFDAMLQSVLTANFPLIAPPHILDELRQAPQSGSESEEEYSESEEHSAELGSGAADDHDDLGSEGPLSPEPDGDISFGYQDVSNGEVEEVSI